MFGNSTFKQSEANFKESIKCMGEKAASILLKLFRNGNKRCKIKYIYLRMK